MNAPATPTIDRTIYPMPMFATFQVTDITAAVAVYESVGFVGLATIPGPGGTARLVHLRRMKYQDLLLVSGRPQRGSTTVSFAAGMDVRDLAQLATTLRSGVMGGPGEIGGVRIEGPTDTPWFTSDLTIDDPDGNRVILTAPRETEMGRARDWARENIDGDFIVET